jgi:PDZ domain-containing protein
MRRQRPVRRVLLYALGIIVLVAFVASFYIPLPYYVYTPGEAINLQPVVTAGAHTKARDSSLYMMTVRVIYARNIYTLLAALTLPHHQVIPASELTAGYTQREYFDIEQYMMHYSHQASEVAALRYLGRPVAVRPTGVAVVTMLRDSPSFGILHAMDVITAVDGYRVVTLAQFEARLTPKRIGSTVVLRVVEAGHTHDVRVRVMALPGLGKDSGSRPGIGFLPAQAVAIQTPVPIHINTGAIDGPSAGLMFAVDIVDRLTGGTLAQGYRIAGTGTLTANGVVGQIGGITHKVVAAAAAGVQYFFSPADVAPGDTNTAHAEAEVRKLGLHIRVVPVRSLAQAIAFLRRLPRLR